MDRDFLEIPRGGKMDRDFLEILTYSQHFPAKLYFIRICIKTSNLLEIFFYTFNLSIIHL